MVAVHHDQLVVRARKRLPRGSNSEGLESRFKSNDKEAELTEKSSETPRSLNVAID